MRWQNLHHRQVADGMVRRLLKAEVRVADREAFLVRREEVKTKCVAEARLAEKVQFYFAFLCFGFIHLAIPVYLWWLIIERGLV